MNNKKGIAFCDILGIVFIVLKLCHVIKWSWLWVLSPIWLSIIIEIIISIYFAVKIEKLKKK